MTRPDAIYCRELADTGGEYVIVCPEEHDHHGPHPDGPCIALAEEWAAPSHWGIYVASALIKYAATVTRPATDDESAEGLAVPIFVLSDADLFALVADDRGDLTFVDTAGAEQYASDWVTSLLAEAESALCAAGYYVDWWDGGCTVYSVDATASPEDVAPNDPDPAEYDEEDDEDAPTDPGELPGCRAHGDQECRDPSCTGNVFASELRDAETWIGTT